MTPLAEYWDQRARDFAGRGAGLRAVCSYGMPAFYNGYIHLTQELALAPHLRVAPGTEVLDLGCGIGRLTRVMAGRAAHVTALDVSPEMLARAQELNPALDNVEWVLGDGTSLTGVEDASHDVVVSHVVLQHIPDPRVQLAYVAEFGRVLRPGGWAAFQVSNDPDVHARDYPRPKLLDRIRRRAPKGQDDPAWRGSAVDLDELRRAAAGGGMAVDHVTGEGTQYCLVLLRRR